MEDFRERAERVLQSVRPQYIASSKAAMVIAEALVDALQAVHGEARKAALERAALLIDLRGYDAGGPDAIRALLTKTQEEG